jgi:hypothetical protein
LNTVSGQPRDGRFDGFIEKPITVRSFLEVVEDFFLESTYVAKHLWRDRPGGVRRSP